MAESAAREAMISEAIRLYASGLSCVAVGARLGDAPPGFALERKRERADALAQRDPSGRERGEAFRHRRDSEQARLRARAAELHSAGWTAARIGKEIGRSQLTVGKLLRRAGVAPHAGQRLCADGAEIARRYLLGEDRFAIATALGIHRGTVWYHLRKRGIRVVRSARKAA